MRLSAITTIGAAAIAAFAAAPASAQGEFAVLMKTLANPFWGAMAEGVEDGAREADIEYKLQAVESDQAAESQLNVCNTMLERDPAVMITAAINSTNLLPCLARAQEAGIGIVDLDGNLDPEILEAEGIDTATGQRLFAFVHTRPGDRLAITEGLEAWGHAKQAMDFWAKKLVERLDKAHGIAPAK